MARKMPQYFFSGDQELTIKKVKQWSSEADRNSDFLFLKSRAVRINKLRCAVEIMNYKRAQRRKFRPRLPG